MANRFIIGAVGLLLGGMTWVLLLPDRKPPTLERTSTAPTVVKSEPEQPKAAVRPVRVVYPNPEASDINNVSPAIAAAVKNDAVPDVGSVVASTPSSNEKSSILVPPTSAGTLPIGDGPPLENKQVIDINSGSIEALNHLEGGGRIGATIARHRPYRSIEDLLNKRVVRKDVYDRIRTQLAVQ